MTRPIDEKPLPSNHLCSSQLGCVNFLYPFASRPKALAALPRPVMPNLAVMISFESGRYIEFEWIGERNYVNEKVRGHERIRGAYCTSTDAAVMFRQSDDVKKLILVDWKYTESYGDKSLARSKNGTDRVAIYRPLLRPIIADYGEKGQFTLVLCQLV
jgi:hypothetical protein